MSPPGTRSRSSRRSGWRSSGGVLKPTGTIFAFTSYNMLGRWHEVFDPAFDTFQFIVWHKTNPPPKLRRVGFLNQLRADRLLLGQGPHLELHSPARHAQLHRGPDLRRQRAGEGSRSTRPRSRSASSAPDRVGERARRPRSRSVHGRRVDRASPRSSWAGGSSGSRSTIATWRRRGAGSRAPRPKSPRRASGQRPGGPSGVAPAGTASVTLIGARSSPPGRLPAMPRY